MKQPNSAGAGWAAVPVTAGLYLAKKGEALWDPTAPMQAGPVSPQGTPNPTLFPPVPTKRGVEMRSCISQGRCPATGVRRLEMPNLWVMRIFTMKLH